MASFLDLQNRFQSTQFAVLGLDAASGQSLQPIKLLPVNDDASLWRFFNAIPQAGPLYEASEATFFDGYSAVIGALVGGGPLDPVTAAQNHLKNWGDKPPAWSQNYAALKKQLAAAPQLSFPFSSPGGAGAAFWGLWGDSPALSGPADVFASGEVKGNVSFAHALSFAPSPGNWYVGTALNLAYATPNGPPWNPAASVNWQTAFGPGGTLPRLVASLSVVSGIKAQFQSSAVFSPADQAALLAHVKEGLWPYYLPAEAGHTTAQFSSSGRLTLTIASENNVPIVIAARVLGIQQYLGG